ncbi:unnamed protein product [Moneuplotes crassus]|uniref:Uncharacterized protein n=1 Tax=Euplotes crassus TaxID=5936 RepID=A0AAD1XUS8_EUPCR|nr:unnamed protein product [Moneuplotes crassus]
MLRKIEVGLIVIANLKKRACCSGKSIDFSYSERKNDLSDSNTFNEHGNICKIEEALKTLNSDEQKEILESYFRYLRTHPNTILSINFKDIKIQQVKDYWLFKKNTLHEPMIDANIKGDICEHYEGCKKESFYYLPEICIKICFKHRFHKAYFFCSKYTPLFKFDLRLTLRILDYLQMKASTSFHQRFELQYFRLKDTIIDTKIYRNDLLHKCILLVQNEVLMNCTECYEPVNKVLNFYAIEKILLKLIENHLDSDIRDHENYWMPTLNDYESDIKFIQNMLKIEILEYIRENRFPKYWRRRQADSKIEEIIEYLNKDYVPNNKELESNFKKIESNIDTISSQEGEDNCFSTFASNKKMRLNCESKPKKAFTSKTPYSYEESFQSSLNISDCDSQTNEKFHKDNNSFNKFSSEEYLNQQEESDSQLDKNNYDDIEDISFYKTADFEKSETSSSESSFSEITSMSGLKTISELGKRNTRLKTSNITRQVTQKCERKLVWLKNTLKRNLKTLFMKLNKQFTQNRKSYLCQFKYKSLSEYFIKQKLYKLKLCVSDDLLISEYDLSNFGDFCEFASDLRWKDQISISSQNKITVILDTKKNINILSFIKTRPCEVENVDLKIHEQNHVIVNNFLANYFPEKCQNFKLSYIYGPKSLINFYFDSLIGLSSRITQKIYILRWKLSQQQMEAILKAFKHVEVLKIWYCIIGFESVPEFGTSLEGSKIKELALRGNDYGDNGYGIEHLIQGLSQSSDFMQNVDKINLYKSGINEEDAEQTLKEYADIGKLNFRPPEKKVKRFKLSY